MNEQPDHRERRLSLGAGVLVGFVATLLVLVLRTLAPNAEIASNGADLTRHNAARLVVADEKVVLAQATCRDACDDLRLEARVGETSVYVRVIDAAGRTICCGPGIYTDASSKTVLNVSGGDSLELKTRYDVFY